MKTVNAYSSMFSPVMAIRVLGESGLRWRMHPIQACAVTQAMLFTVEYTIHTVEKKEPVDLSKIPPMCMAAIEVVQDTNMPEDKIQLLFGETVIGEIVNLSIPL